MLKDVDITYDFVDKQLEYSDAWMFCLTLNHNGYKDWRLPEFIEYIASADLTNCWYENGYHAEGYIKRVFPVRTTEAPL